MCALCHEPPTSASASVSGGCCAAGRAAVAAHSACHALPCDAVTAALDDTPGDSLAPTKAHCTAGSPTQEKCAAETVQVPKSSGVASCADWVDPHWVSHAGRQTAGRREGQPVARGVPPHKVRQAGARVGGLERRLQCSRPCPASAWAHSQHFCDSAGLVVGQARMRGKWEVEHTMSDVRLGAASRARTSLAPSPSPVLHENARLKSILRAGRGM